MVVTGRAWEYITTRPKTRSDMDALSPERNTAVFIITLTVVCRIPTTWMSSRGSAVEIAEALM